MVAVVAGAGPGIGRACATAFGHAGADVILAARDAERLAALAADVAAETGQQVLPLPADLADVASCRALVDQAAEWFGRIDVLVNVATYGGAIRAHRGQRLAVLAHGLRGERHRDAGAEPRRGAGHGQVGRRLHHPDRHVRHARAPRWPRALHGDQAGDGDGVPHARQGARAPQRAGQRGHAGLHRRFLARLHGGGHCRADRRERRGDVSAGWPRPPRSVDTSSPPTSPGPCCSWRARVLAPSPASSFRSRQAGDRAPPRPMVVPLDGDGGRLRPGRQESRFPGGSRPCSSTGSRTSPGSGAGVAWRGSATTRSRSANRSSTVRQT